MNREKTFNRLRLKRIELRKALEVSDTGFPSNVIYHIADLLNELTLLALGNYAEEKDSTDTRE